MSNHAKLRLKERCGLNKKATFNLAEKAFYSGLSHSDLSGSARRYTESLFLNEHVANNIKIYGHNVFLFKGRTLITVLSLPHKYVKYIDKRQESIRR